MCHFIFLNYCFPMKLLRFSYVEDYNSEGASFRKFFKNLFQSLSPFLLEFSYDKTIIILLH